ncbi:hypothetical protein CA11_58800 [Gimesia maris]|uniref:metallopeptidase n=1 Tax=Gimesia maris TaxID=122 RepID=UPI0011891DDD|nr:metallopeptidase [Gimesia maris]QDU18029.1 hypothetical protein CA11_58800 [Gimesia maris]
MSPRMLIVCFLLCTSLIPLRSSFSMEEKKTFPDPVEKQIEGWTVDVDPQLFSEEHAELGEKALDALANHLQRVKYIVPPERVAALQKFPIWLDLQHAELDKMQYHPSRGWLEAHGYDPRLAQHVHIPVARQLLNRNMWAQHPYVVLHELAHAYHDQVLSFDQAEIVATYDAAKQAGIYESVLCHTGIKVRHYGLNNHKEYFAESTEAYFGVNDFYPFVRAELKQHDPAMFTLLVKIWGPIP